MAEVTRARRGGTDQLRERLRPFATLPGWLLAAVDRERVGAALRACVPGLLKCSVGDFRDLGATWAVRYELTVEGHGPVVLAGTLYPPGHALPKHADQWKPFGTASWRCQLPQLGLDLHVEPHGGTVPVVGRLTRPEELRGLLEAAIGERVPGFRIAACTPRVVRAQADRCTLLCDLAYAPDVDAAVRGWPERVVVKTYQGDKGANAWAGMRTLWDGGLGDGGLVILAEPLAFVPELRVLVQRPIPEQDNFKDFMRACLRAGTVEAQAELDAYTARTARGLAALHRCGLRYGETVTIDDELAELRQVLADIADPFGELADAATPLLERVEQLAGEHPADPAVISHRSFRPVQVLLDLDHGRVGLIDFDGLCMAEPALDVALFRASVKDLGIDKRTARADPQTRLARVLALERVADRFLDDYQAAAPVSRERVVLWETLDLLTNVLRCWTKVKPERVETTMLLLDRHLAASEL